MSTPAARHPDDSLDWPADGKVSGRYLLTEGTTDIGLGVRIHNAYEVKGTGYHGYNIHAIVRLRGGKLGIDELHVYKSGDGEPVTSEGLRGIPLRSFLRHAFGVIEYEDGNIAWGLLAPSDRDRMRRDGPTKETIEMVAKLYLAAYVIGERPVKTVREIFDVPRPTAESWIRKARADGLLGEAGGPGKAGA